MAIKNVLATGFGRFENVPVNASGLIAKALNDFNYITGLELPVSYRRSQELLRKVYDQHKNVSLILGLGVHGEAGFRFEQQAGTVFLDYPDVDGENGLLFSSESNILTSSLDVTALVKSTIERTGLIAEI